MRAHLVWPVEQPVLQQERGPVGEERLPLHLPEAQPSAPPSPLDGLLRHLVHRAHLELDAQQLRAGVQQVKKQLQELFIDCDGKIRSIISVSN